MGIKKDLLGISVNNWQEVERIQGLATKAAQEDKPTKAAFFLGEAKGVESVAKRLSAYIETLPDEE